MLCCVPVKSIHRSQSALLTCIGMYQVYANGTPLQAIVDTAATAEAFSNPNAIQQEKGNWEVNRHEWLLGLR